MCRAIIIQHMSQRILYSLIETPLFPNLSDLCQSLSIRELRFDSMRKAIGQLRSDKPDFVIGEFVYGYGNNYAGVNVCNLDVFLYSLQKYAPAAKVIVLVEKPERAHVDKLAALFDMSAILTLPLTGAGLRPYLAE